MIPQTEYRERMKKLKNAVQQRGLDAFLVTSKDSIYYLAGLTYEPLERPFFMLVSPENEAKLLVPALEKEHVSNLPNVGSIMTYWDYPAPEGEGWPEKLLELINDVHNLGIEPSLPQEISIRLSQRNPMAFPLVEELRLVKSKNEIAMLRQASEFARKGMEAIISAAYFGVSEIEIFSLGRSILMEIIKTTTPDLDPLNTSVLTAAWPSRLALQPHGVPSIDDRLETGPHIALSLMRVNGYSAECERTFFVESPTTEMREMFMLMKEARRRAVAVAKPGVSCAEVDRAAKTFLRDEGLGEYFLHRTGHGFGVNTHEGPWVAEGSDEILQENMLISIEPGIYVSNLGAFRQSDTFLVTKDGIECLTPYPDDIKSLTILDRKIFTRFRGYLVRRAVGIA